MVPPGEVLFPSVFIAALLLLNTADSASPFVVTSVGVIQGTEESSPDGLLYFAFRGIRYARPPTGGLRWKPPVALPEWQGVYEATDFRPGCPQLTTKVTTSEDCLFLDVYVPHNVSGLYNDATKALEAWEKGDNATASPATEDSRPVMIWIHGGSYHSGYSQKYSAWKVATEQDVVVVVVQYRLGALGFLSSGDSTLPGNYGLWDQRLAMMWVKANIRAFGGNGAMVTIAGESAGSSSVSQHTLSRHASGLFQRAVMMSGTAEAAWCFNNNPRASFDQFSVNAGCGDASSSLDHRLDCLMKLSADDIHAAAVTTEGSNFVTFVPNIDGDFFPDNVQNLLNDDAYLSSIGFYDYETLVGVLNNEGVVIYGLLTALVPTLLTTGRLPYAAVDNVLLDGMLGQELGGRYGPDVKDTVNYRYFYPRDPATSSLPVQHFFDLYTDASFVAPALKYLRHRSRAAASPSQPPAPATARSPSRSYLYLFDWFPSLTAGTVLAGMPHALDVDYLLGLTNDSLLLYGELPLGGVLSEAEERVSRLYGDMIGAFVRTGNPNDGITAAVNLTEEWLPYDASNETFLRFSLFPSTDRHLYASRASLWIDLVPRLHSRWLQETTNGSTENTAGQSEKLTDFGVTESEANTMLISLIVVSAVLLLFNALLLVAFISLYRRKPASKHAVDRESGFGKAAGHF